jgi:hypothetical protein
MTERKRAKCLYCGTKKAVTPSGKIWAHYVISGPTTVNPGKRVLCGGSGRPA